VVTKKNGSMSVPPGGKGKDIDHLGEVVIVTQGH